MYNFKQKKLHFKALRNPDAAIYDLELLRKGCPWLPQLRTYARDPKRYADEILYSLLDHTTRENIRAFRRQKLDELKTVAEVSGTGSETPSANAITATDNDTTAADETPGTGGETPPVSETTTDNGIPATDETTSTDNTENSPASEKIEELEQSLEEAEERADEAEQRAEEAEEAQEEAETRAEEAEQALETEKKKEQPVAAPAKSKSTRSTRKSTGITSSTRKSK